MSVSVIRQQLEEFQREVLAGHCLSEDQNQLIARIADDLALLCDDEELQQREAEDGVLSSQLDQQAVNFEQDHPTLAQIMRQLVDSLAKMGV